jgi:hypothetical protein
MKKFLACMLFIAFLVQLCPAALTTSIDTVGTYKNAYRWTGNPADKILDWAQEMEDLVDGTSTTGVASIVYTPGTEPTSTEGRLYYDSGENKLKFYNGSSWVAIESGSAGNSLDGAYSIGSAVTVDTATVGLTATDAADVIALTVTQGDTGATVAQTIINAGTGACLTFDSNGTGGDLLGSDSTWSVSKAGAFVGVVGTWTGDQTWTGSNANIVIDVTDDELLIEDDAQISFGDGADVTATWDATNLLIEAAAQDTGIIKIGATNALDFNIYGNTATDIASFDAGAGALLLDSYPLALGDGDAILFGDTLGTGDFTISDASDVLVINNVVDGTGTVAFGVADTGLDVAFYGDAGTGDMIWDEDQNTNGALIFDNADIEMGDADFVQFGDGADFTIHSTTTKQLQIDGANSDETDAVHIGADSDGIDLSLHGATASDQLVGDLVLFTLAEAAGDQFKVDATGTVAGDAINFETTDGGIMLNADGAANGDIEINAGDDVIITANAAVTVTNTEAMTISGPLSPNGAVLGDGGDTLYGFRREIEVEAGTDETLLATDSGKVFANTATNGVTTFTLPAAAAGLTFTFVDVSATAADDVLIQAVGDDKINGGTAAKIYQSVTDAIPATVTITAIDATNWHVTSEAGTWANNDA